MLLQNRNAVIYGAGGSLGSAVARAMGNAGAKLFLTGRNLTTVQRVADEILAAGGKVQVDVVDGMDEKAINAHIERLVGNGNSIDISFNAVGVDVKQDAPLVEMTEDEFIQPITDNLRTRFLTAKAAGKVMVKQGAGVILSLTATPGGIGYPYTGGFAPACCAMECFAQNLASELGIYGVRVVNIRSGGSPDSRIFREAIDNNPEIMGPVLKGLEADTMLKELPLVADIANTAVFLASDMAAKITGVTIDVTAGTTAALNYRSRTW
jgi:NAD(P)-dependent dehydrogenase (short-subunit alcohol dehydrogenase family)